MRTALHRLHEAHRQFYQEKSEYRANHAADIRERDYKLRHGSPQHRAQNEQFERKQAAEAELAKAKERPAPHTPKSDPTNEDEAAHADAHAYWHDWSSQQAESYTDQANASDAAGGAGVQAAADDAAKE
jgi:hypothetical protein